MKPLLSHLTTKNIACFILVLFCIQYIPIESRAGISYFKLAVSALCPFIFIFYTPKITKALFWCVIYYCLVVFAAIMHPTTLRWSTVLFLLSFLITYITFYNLIIAEKAFNYNFFLQLVKNFLLAYFITLLIQQLFIIVGIKTFTLINLVQVLDRGIGANSLSYEPSTSARILTLLFLAMLRMYELKYGRSLSIQEIYQEAKWPTIGFLWCMLTMGSGTAFIALGILSLYFIRRQYAFIIIPLLIVFYILIPYIEFEPLQRAYKTFNAFLTLDTDIVRKADGSAAARVVPLVNTITSLDLMKWETWFGHGVDYSLSSGVFSKIITIGGIGDYGLLSFIVMQILVYSCAIKRFFSIETLLWIGLFNMTLGNIPFQWGSIMLLTCSRYFAEQRTETKNIQ